MISHCHIFSSKPRAGFTMVEMLVVIGIMGVLAALLMPVLGRMQEKSKNSTCMHNLRQIASGFLLYAGENDGQLPPSDIKDPADASARSQKEKPLYQIWEYVGYSYSNFKHPDNDTQGNQGADRNVFHCPVTKYYSGEKFSEIMVPGGDGIAGNRYSYAMNAVPEQVQFPVSATELKIPARLASIQNPSKTALVYEQREGTGNQFLYHNYYGLIPHSGNMNVAFVDGHVESIAYADVPPAHGYTSKQLSQFWSGEVR